MHSLQNSAATFFQHQPRNRRRLDDCIIHPGSSFTDTLAALKQFAGKVTGRVSCVWRVLDRLKQFGDRFARQLQPAIVTFKNGHNIRAAVAATGP